MKHCMWQALYDCVPTAERLTYRHLSTNKAVLDVVIQWSRLTIFLWNAPSPVCLGFIELFVPSVLLSEYFYIPKYELSILEEKKCGSTGTTI